MDKVSGYRQILKKLLIEYRDWAEGANQPDIQQCVAFDDERGHYFWFSLGWQDKKRDFSTSVYLRIENGQVWIEEDWTKQGIANELLAAGIPSEDIVLGFQHPSKRPLTEFSTGLPAESESPSPGVLSDDRLLA